MDDPDSIETVDDSARLLPRSRTTTETAPNRDVSTSHNEDERPTKCSEIWCNPTSLYHRLIALALMCLLGFGSYFCFDNPGALQKEIKDAMGISTYQFANLYAWYSWPNVILPIIGGYLMDSVFGIRLGTILFALFIIIGQVIVGMGALADNYPVMQIGRFVFGIGGESLAVAQNTYAVSWFKGKELNMVFGFQLSIARVGSTVNFLLMEPLYNYLVQFCNPHSAVGWALLIAGLTCVMSFVCSLVLGVLDKRAEKLLKKEASSEPPPDIRIKDVLYFPVTFWLTCAIALFYYIAIYTFISLGQVYFIKKFGFTASNANFINGLIYLLSAPASPILGFLIDKTGRNVLYCTISILTTLLGHLMLAFSFMNPYFAIIILGISYSLLASALWPIVALIIPEYQLGTAYGVMQAIQNAGLALLTMLAGLIVDWDGYLWLELFFIVCLVVAFVCNTAIWVIDYCGDRYLNMGIQQRAEYDEAKAKKAAEEARKRALMANPIRPKTAQELRNRYLLRIGAGLPPHLGHAGLVVHPVELSSSPRV